MLFVIGGDGGASVCYILVLSKTPFFNMEIFSVLFPSE